MLPVNDPFLCAVKSALTMIFLSFSIPYYHIASSSLMLIPANTQCESHTLLEAVRTFSQGSVGSEEPPVSAKSLYEHTKTLFLHYCDLMSSSMLGGEKHRMYRGADKMFKTYWLVWRKTCLMHRSKAFPQLINMFLSMVERK